MNKKLLKPLLLAVGLLMGASAWAADKTVVKYSFDNATSPSLTAGSRVSFDYDKTSVITSTKFLNAYNNANGDPGASTISLGSTDLSGETWTLSFEWAACGGCNSKADHTTLKAGDKTLFDFTGNSNWNTTVTITYEGSDGTKTLPVPGCDKSNRFTAAVGNQLNTTDYWHHIVVTGSAEGVKMTITNSNSNVAVVENVVLSTTNVNPTSLIIEPCCGGAIGIDELSLTYFVEGEVIQTPVAAYTAVDGVNRTITATCETEGATIQHSTDGVTYEDGASVTVSESGDIYFKAVKGTSESDVLTFAAVAGTEIELVAPVINRTSNTSVTISADETSLLLSPVATIYYEYGSQSGSFLSSETKNFTVEADATITAYAEATGYATSDVSERAVAQFPGAVATIENTPTKTSGITTSELSSEIITVSGREYAALLLDDTQWGTNVYLQNLTLSDPIVWGVRNGNWYINTTDPQWILIRNMNAGDIIVLDVNFPASDMVNATYSEKYTYGNRYAYIVTADGDVELAVKKPSANDMDYLYGVYVYRPMTISSMRIVGFTTEAGLSDADKWSPANGIAMTQSETNPCEWNAVVNNYVIAGSGDYELKYYYKAVANDAYGIYELPSSGNQNYNFNYAEAGAGMYKLTFTANTSTHSVSLAIEKQATGQVYFVNTSNWDEANVKIWVWDANNGNYNYTGGEWPGVAMSKTTEQVGGHDVYTWSTYDITGTPTNIIISNNGSNTERTGDQPFVNGAYYKADGVSTVEQNITAAGWSTLYTANALNFAAVEGLTAYTATCDGSTVTLTKVDNVPAGTGVVLKGEAKTAKTYSIPVIASSETDKGDLIGSTSEALAYDENATSDYYFLALNKENKAQFTKLISGSIAAGKAYLALAKTPTPSARILTIEFADETTGINMVNGQERNTNCQFYDLQGRRVMNPAKGLYIVNGKKVIVK